jgi:uncharacterized protein YggU (UPF0235/DUF167 family)
LRYAVLVEINSSGKILIQKSEITISIKSKPERGKANRELIQKLADTFKISVDNVHIISGLGSPKD